MPRKKNAELPLTPLELEIMAVLWNVGAASVQTVQEKLHGRNLAYTTVQTMLSVLHRKRRVARRMKERAYVYRPLVSRQSAIKEALDEMLGRFFGGSVDGLVLSMVETQHLTPEKLKRIQEIIDRSEKDRHAREQKHGDH